MMTFKFYGISTWIGPRAEMLSVSLEIWSNFLVKKFQVAAMFYFGVNIFLSQDFCLLYRYTAILESNRWHEIFVTKRMKFFLFVIAQCLSIAVFCFIYMLMVPPEVFFANLIIPHPCLELLRRNLWNATSDPAARNSGARRICSYAVCRLKSSAFIHASSFVVFSGVWELLHFHGLFDFVDIA
jgi:hypothetical protein